MIVIADTSVILNLCRIGRVELLQALFSEVYAPREVADEFTRIVSTYPLFAGMFFPSWIGIREVSGSLKKDHPQLNLDAGESAAIQLAIESKANAVLLDERLGREAAMMLGLQVLGILGVLLLAKQCGLLGSVRPVLDELQSRSRFWLSEKAREKFLFLAEETD